MTHRGVKFERTVDRLAALEAFSLAVISLAEGHPSLSVATNSKRCLQRR